MSELENTPIPDEESSNKKTITLQKELFNRKDELKELGEKLINDYSKRAKKSLETNDLKKENDQNDFESEKEFREDLEKINSKLNKIRNEPSFFDSPQTESTEQDTDSEFLLDI